MRTLVDLVRSEMKPSVGCTEPVAVGLAVSKTCQYLSAPATHIQLHVSTNIFKNAYCVKIPNTNKAGVPLAAALGFLLSQPGDTMEIFSGVTDSLVEQGEELLTTGFLETSVFKDSNFQIEITASNRSETVKTLTFGGHDQMIHVEKDGQILVDEPKNISGSPDENTFKEYTIDQIIDYCQSVPVEELSFIGDAIEMNMKLSVLGRSGEYGLGVGAGQQKAIDTGLLDSNLTTRVKIATASASDFRMGGGNAPAMTLVGSGNQGIEAFVPVAVVAEELSVSKEMRLRAGLLSALITIYIKYHVGRLSPVCAAIFSGAGASAATVWMMGGNVDQMKGAIQNMMGSLPAMVCDGAKDGCALKLFTCSGEAIHCALLALSGVIIQATDGIICATVEDTIRSVARLSQQGLESADDTMISIMVNK